MKNISINLAPFECELVVGGNDVSCSCLNRRQYDRFQLGGVMSLEVDSMKDSDDDCKYECCMAQRAYGYVYSYLHLKKYGVEPRSGTCEQFFAENPEAQGIVRAFKDFCSVM